MDHADIIIDTIEAYMETNRLSEEDLSIIFQMDFDDEENSFRIDYVLTSHTDKEAMTIHTGFGYDTLPEAWDNYLDQISEVYQNFQSGDVRGAPPEEYSGGKIGGNPVMSIRDALGEFSHEEL